MRFSSTGNRLSYAGIFLSSGVPPASTDPSLTIWYDSVNSVFSPVNPPNETYLTAWGDKSATAHDANSSGNNAVKPRYRTGIQMGKPAVYFDGVNDLFTINPFPSIQNLSGYTYFFVGKTIVIGNNQILTVMKGSGAGDIQELFLQIGATGVVTVGAAGATATSSIINTNYHLHTIIFDGSKSTNSTRLRHRLDGVEQTLTYTGTVGTTANANTTYLYLGTDTAGNNDFDGYMSEVVVYTKALTSGDIANTEAYLKNKWGIS